MTEALDEMRPVAVEKGIRVGCSVTSTPSPGLRAAALIRPLVARTSLQNEVDSFLVGLCCISCSRDSELLSWSLAAPISLNVRTEEQREGQRETALKYQMS